MNHNAMKGRAPYLGNRKEGSGTTSSREAGKGKLTKRRTGFRRKKNTKGNNYERLGGGQTQCPGK